MKPRKFLFAVVAAVMLCAGSTPAQQQSSEEKTVWGLEQAYWNYVKALDLESYRKLWHPNFVGWPMSSPKPVRKDHITDWITAQTEKGENLQSFTLDESASQATGNIVVTHYLLTAAWAGKNGAGEHQTTRITHTWIQTADGWQIIGGMSAFDSKPAP